MKHDQTLDEKRYFLFEKCNNEIHDYCCGTGDEIDMQNRRTGEIEYNVPIIEFECGCKAFLLEED